MIKYFHELTEQELDGLIHTPGYTWQMCMKDYPQPTWCGYPEAIEPLGCWSLVLQYIKCEADCQKCDCYQPANKEVNP